MYTADDVRNVRFPNRMNGYSKDEVDTFLDGVEEDYRSQAARVAELEAQVASLRKEIETLSISQSGIQNVLISAQKLADQIVAEAKAKAEEVIVEAKVRANEITQQAEEQVAAEKRVAEQNRQKAEAEYTAVMRTTAEKSQEMITAAHDSVARQQLLFDKLKLDIVNFKAQIMAIYKEHIDALSKLPDEVPFDAARAAEAAAFAYDSRPTFEQPAAEEAPAEETAEEINAEETAPADEAPAAEPEQDDAITEPDVKLGFQVTIADEETDALDEDEDGEDDDDEEDTPRFFRRKR